MRFTPLAIAGFAALMGVQSAQAVTLDASTWIDADDPIKENQSATSETGDGFVSIRGNGDLAVVTDYAVAPPFQFSGQFSAPGDDDILGIVFGYEDGFNNYRITWTGGEDHDWEAGPRFGGLMLVREDDGVTDVLFRNASLLWTAGIEYTFSLSVDAAQTSFDLAEGTNVLASFTVMEDFSDAAGAVGVFTRSNAANFYALSDETVNVIPVPGGMPLFLSAAGLLFWVGRRSVR